MLTAALALVLADTPEGALKEFVEAINKGDVAAAVKLIDGADPKVDRTEISKVMRSPSHPKLVIGEIRRDGDRLIVDSQFLDGEKVVFKVQGDTIGVVQRGGDWLLVAGKSSNDPKALLSSITTALKDDSFAKQAKSASLKTQALSNLKQIALATMMYAADYNDVLKMSTKVAESKIQPYLKDLKVFEDPGTGRNDVYRFNDLLTNVPFSKISEPANTVLWSIGPRTALLYPYGEGKQTIIAYADGHVKVATKEQVANLRWKP